MNQSVLESAMREGLTDPSWDIVRLFPNQGQWADEDYLLLPTNRLVELSQGRIEVLPMPTRSHQRFVLRLANLFQAFLEPEGRGEVVVAPYPVRLWEGKFREPDVVVALAAHVTRLGESHADGADLVIEVVSPGDAGRDRVVKREEYARAGIPEYWIVDPSRGTISVLHLAGEAYVETVHGSGDRARSILIPGLEADVDSVLSP